MGAVGDRSHVVVTPSRNEANFLTDLAESIVNQSLLPARWVIVDHNSSDETRKILSEYKLKYDWISVVTVSDDNKRKRGSQIAKLFNLGISSSGEKWSFCSKIDADMILPPNYFEDILSKFDGNNQLGIASGTCYVIHRNKKKIEHVSRDHTRGGLKTYRRSCYEDIGGIMEVDGWDGIDNILAQMNGWETRNFYEIEVLHRRMTGSYFGLSRGCFEAGQFSYSMRYFPLFIAARSFHRMFSPPHVVGGVSMLLGYLTALISRRPSIGDAEVIQFLREKQKSRIFFWRKR